MTVLAIETNIYGYYNRIGLESNMAIVTVLAIEIDIYSYRDHTGLETDIDIMTVLAIETNIHLSGIEPGIKCKEFVWE